MNHKPSIVVHALVKNEARWLWYSISSVIDYVDKILLWDTGSTDGTLEIIEELRKKYPNKIDYREYGEVTPETFTKARQEMLEETLSDWFIVVDADEIWWKESIKKVSDTIREKGDELESIVVPTVNLVGDIFHHQPESAGKYKIAGKVGHYNLRAINRIIPGLQALGPHGKMGWADGEGKMIQDRNPEKIKLIDAAYLHATNLKRASGGKDTEVIKRKKKLKYEFGISFPKDFYYPESFFGDHPDFVESPWRVMDLPFKFRAFFETPLKAIKRKILPDKIGY
jgi:glycosyltransferase involved in cell wall biosynthesis